MTKNQIFNEISKLIKDPYIVLLEFKKFIDSYKKNEHFKSEDLLEAIDLRLTELLKEEEYPIQKTDKSSYRFCNNPEFKKDLILMRNKDIVAKYDISAASVSYHKNKIKEENLNDFT